MCIHVLLQEGEKPYKYPMKEMSQGMLDEADSLNAELEPPAMPISNVSPEAERRKFRMKMMNP